jgi:demethylmenaquinone methyltransferase/2-methoxy-6-polyprenyl-1,4-benzoquinol methylase
MLKPESGDTKIEVPGYYREGFWNKLSPRYDLLMKASLLPFGTEGRIRSRFIQFAKLKDGEHVLDICCGTGSLTVLLAQRVAPSGRVTGIDLSHSMMEIARKRSRLNNLSYHYANSEALPFSNGLYDKAFVSLSLHEMPDSVRRNTLKEAYRILKPGGKLFILDYALPAKGFARWAIKLFVKSLEEDFAYRMLLTESLLKDVRQLGFSVADRKSICAGTLQMVEAVKGQQEDFHVTG